MTVKEFKGEYRFLSNFWLVPGGVFLNEEWDETPYPTVENAYQAAKCDTKEARELFKRTTPGQAKRLGKYLHLREDWSEIKVPIMKLLIGQKFCTQDMGDKLCGINGDIVEGNYWHDNFWGDCYCVICKDIEGQNVLGKILMELRQLIIEDRGYELGG